MYSMLVPHAPTLPKVLENTHLTIWFGEILIPSILEECHG